MASKTVTRASKLGLVAPTACSCGTPIQPTGRRGHPKLYCSPQCKARAKYDRRADAREAQGLPRDHHQASFAAVVDRQCQMCSKGFSTSHATKITCSVACSDELNRLSRGVPCVSCGRVLHRAGKGAPVPDKSICQPCRRARICSEPECEERGGSRGLCSLHYYRAIRDRRLGNPECPVEGCNRGAREDGLCGAHRMALKRAGGYKAPQSKKGHSGKPRRRVAKYGLSPEQFDRSLHRMDIFERDHWRCGICRRQVHKHLRWPHPGSAVLDHVVPLSIPGTPGHVPENVQLAHSRCNRTKSDSLGVGVQPALF